MERFREASGEPLKLISAGVHTPVSACQNGPNFRRPRQVTHVPELHLMIPVVVITT
jgi:hypothetical protein